MVFKPSKYRIAKHSNQSGIFCFSKLYFIVRARFSSIGYNYWKLDSHEL